MITESAVQDQSSTSPTVLGLEIMLQQSQNPFDKASLFGSIRKSHSHVRQKSKYEIQYIRNMQTEKKRSGLLSPKHDPELKQNLRDILLDLELKTPPTLEQDWI